ncbi:hypothetical protein EMIHUDRAFT_106230 [Emiliania huxleyi CCMP1516]|uniref:Amidohydrolase-related domain-containing protein n=2 Tax=Emiliania huxleyi TaxID=2903 RepID=A0A0D3IAC0_EMIH1|nr:hypothetical protein EMIHUDRAFT_106230 [Emiliania huxleyi CCMP1516]EOD08205.1 hypothetical protein EMIHUDRAFT_106230 [Emiliania huxleyi CCMP1516]|eukprot:XP_005760634.1 hypothetical protein EMIHUDRAFT_106230 [Emiliania huxleyi CCMP1516]
MHFLSSPYDDPCNWKQEKINVSSYDPNVQHSWPAWESTNGSCEDDEYSSSTHYVVDGGALLLRRDDTKPKSKPGSPNCEEEANPGGCGGYVIARKPFKFYCTSDDQERGDQECGLDGSGFRNGEIWRQFGPGSNLYEDRRPGIVVPGFFDLHVHSNQEDILAAYGKALLPWLKKYTIPAEDRSRTTMPMAFTTANGTGDVARQLFLAAERVNMRIITGTQAQNRYTPDDGFVEKTHELFKWLYYERSDGAKPPPHRSLYGINFRFAPSSSFEQFADLEELMREYRYPNDPNPPAIDKGRDPDGKGAYVLTHMGENVDELSVDVNLFHAKGIAQCYEDRFPLVSYTNAKKCLDCCKTSLTGNCECPLKMDANHIQKCSEFNTDDYAYNPETDCPNVTNYDNFTTWAQLYDAWGILRRGTMLGHAIHLAEGDLQLIAEGGAGLAHNPTSNNFLGSGLFNLGAANRTRKCTDKGKHCSPGEDIRVLFGVGSDMGAGTHLCTLNTLGAIFPSAAAALEGERSRPLLSIVGAMYAVGQLGNTYLTQINPKGQGVKGQHTDKSMICVKSNCPTPWEDAWDWRESIGPNKARCNENPQSAIDVTRPTVGRTTLHQAQLTLKEEGILPGTGSNLVKIELPEGNVPPNHIHVHAALAYYSATLGAAKATLLEDKLGNFEEGKEADFVVLNPYGSFDTARRVRLMGRRDCNPLKQMWEVLFMLMIMGSAENIASTYVMGHEAYQNKEKPLDMAEELCTFTGNTGREPFPRPFTNDYDYYADPGCVNAFAKCVSCLAECTEPHPWGRTLPCGCKAPTYHGNNPDCPELTDYETKNPCKKPWNGNTCTPRPGCPPPAAPPPAPKQP